MKNLFAILVALLLTAPLWAQVPQRMSYQAVIRDVNNNLVTNQTIGMRVSIIQGAVGMETEVYKELYNPNPQTNANGLVTIEIGSGIPQTGTFETIDWSFAPYSIYIETDPTGGTDYTIFSISELLSVPYAMYAKTAENIAGSGHYIGESYGGGIVFYVYDNGQHGLIAATTDQSTNNWWFNETYRYTGATGDGLGAGAMNTAMIIATQMADNQTGIFAAKVCADYSVTVEEVTYGDWYLPSKYELNLLYLQQNVVGGLDNNYYWSSTEITGVSAWYQYFSDGSQNWGNKTNFCNVRAIRAF